MFRSNSSRFISQSLFLLFLGINLFSCNEETLISHPTYTITGAVTDSLSGEPLVSAIVFYNTNADSSLTDSLGEYWFVSDALFPSPLSCTKEGYLTKEIVIQRMKYLYRYDNIDFQLVPVP